MIEELDGVQKVFDLVQCSKKSENRSLGQQEDWVEPEDNNGIQIVDNPLFDMGTWYNSPFELNDGALFLFQRNGW